MAFRRYFPFDVVADGAVTGSPVAPQINLAPATQNIFFGIDDSGNLWVNDAQVGSGGGGLQTATVTLTANQIKSLTNNVGVDVVAGPGAGKMINPISVVLQYKFGTVGYTLPNNNDFLAIGHGPPDTLGSQIFSTRPTFLRYGGDAKAVLGFNGNAAANGPSITEADDVGDFPVSLENAPITIWFNDTTSPTLGDGTLVVTVYYLVVNLS